MSIYEERLKNEIGKIGQVITTNPYANPYDVLYNYLGTVEDERIREQANQILAQTKNPYQALATAIRSNAANTSLGEEFVAGFKSSMYNTMYDFGLLGKALYNKAKELITGEEEPLTEGNILSLLKEKAAQTAPSIQSLGQVYDTKDFLKFTAGGLGQVISYFLPVSGLEKLGVATLSRGMSRLLAKGAAKKEAESLIAKGMSEYAAKNIGIETALKRLRDTTTGKAVELIGRGALPFGYVSAIESGETLKNQLESGQIDLGKAIGGGLIAGALEYAPYSYITGKLAKTLGGKAITETSKDLGLLGKFGLRAYNTLKEGAKAGFFEGLTEGLQTLTERYFGNKDIADTEAINEYINSVALGLTTGAPFGGLHGITQKIVTTQPTIEPEKEQQVIGGLPDVTSPERIVTPTAEVPAPYTETMPRGFAPTPMELGTPPTVGNVNIVPNNLPVESPSKVKDVDRYKDYIDVEWEEIPLLDGIKTYEGEIVDNDVIPYDDLIVDSTAEEVKTLEQTKPIEYRTIYLNNPQNEQLVDYDLTKIIDKKELLPKYSEAIKAIGEYNERIRNTVSVINVLDGIKITDINKNTFKEEYVRKLKSELLNNSDVVAKIAENFNEGLLEPLKEKVTDKAGISYTLLYKTDNNRGALYIPEEYAKQDVDLKQIIKSKGKIPALIYEDGELKESYIDNKNANLLRRVNKLKSKYEETYATINVNTVEAHIKTIKDLENKINSARQLKDIFERMAKTEKTLNKKTKLNNLFKEVLGIDVKNPNLKLYAKKIENTVEALNKEINKKQKEIERFRKLKNQHTEGSKQWKDFHSQEVNAEEDLKKLKSRLNKAYMLMASNTFNQITKDKEFKAIFKDITGKKTIPKSAGEALKVINESLNKMLNDRKSLISKFKDYRISVRKQFVNKITAEYEFLKSNFNNLSKEDINNLLSNGKPLKDQSIFEFINTAAKTDALVTKFTEELLNTKDVEDLNLVKGFYELEGKPEYEMLNISDTLKEHIRAVNKELNDVYVRFKKVFKGSKNPDKKAKKVMKDFVKSIGLLSKTYKAKIDGLTSRIPKVIMHESSQLDILGSLKNEFGDVVIPEVIDHDTLAKDENTIKREIIGVFKDPKTNKLLVSPEVLKSSLLDLTTNYIKSVSNSELDNKNKAILTTALSQYYRLFRGELYRRLLSKMKINENNIPLMSFRLNGAPRDFINDDMVKNIALHAFKTLRDEIEGNAYAENFIVDADNMKSFIKNMIESNISRESKYEEIGSKFVDETDMKKVAVDILNRIGLEKIPAEAVADIKYIHDLHSLNKVTEIIPQVKTFEEFVEENKTKLKSLYKKYKEEIDAKLATAKKYLKDKKALSKTKENLILKTAYENYLADEGSKFHGLTILSKESFAKKTGYEGETLDKKYQDYLKRASVKAQRKLLESINLEDLRNVLKNIPPKILKSVLIDQDFDSMVDEILTSDVSLARTRVPQDKANSAEALFDFHGLLADISDALDQITAGKDLFKIKFIKRFNGRHIPLRVLKRTLKYSYGFTDEQLAKMTVKEIELEYKRILGAMQASVSPDFAATILVALNSHSNPSSLSKTIFHEVFHFFERSGLIPEKDLKALKEYFKDPKGKLDWTELAADAFAVYVNKQLKVKDTVINRIFEAIKTFLRRLRDFLLSRNYRAVEHVFRDIYTGEYVRNKTQNIDSFDEFILGLRDNLRKFNNQVDLRRDDPIIHDPNHKEAEEFLHNANVDYVDFFEDTRRILRKDGLMAYADYIKKKLKAGKEFLAEMMLRGAMPKISKADTAQEWEVLREAMAIPNYAMSRSVRFVRSIIKDLSKEEYDLFNKILVLRDVIKNYVRSFQTEEAILTQFNGVYKSIDDIKAHLAYLENKASDKVKEALRRRNEGLQKLIDQLYNYGYFKERFNAEDYFHRMALFNYKLGQNTGLSLRKFKLNFKPFLLRRTNATEMFVTEYVLSEYEVLAQIFTLIEQHKAMERLKNIYKDDLKELKDYVNKLKLKSKFKGEWYNIFSPQNRHLLKGTKFEDYDVYFVAEYQLPVPGIRLSKKTYKKLKEQALEKGEALASIEVYLDDLNPANFLVNIKRPLLVKKEVAETLDSFMDYTMPSNNIAKELGRKHLAFLKRFLLLNPMSAAHYMINNMAGDLDKVNALNPLITPVYAPKAYKDLKLYFDFLDGSSKVEPPKELIEEIEEAIRLGVINSGLTAAEIPDIVTTEQLKELLGDYDNMIGRYWRKIGKINNVRESILRLAVWRYIRDRMAKGEDFGALASNRDIYYSLKDPDEKAALLSRDLLGDYANISPLGQMLRAYLIPFWSWMEINAPTYMRLFRNAVKDGYKKNGVIGAFYNIASMSTKIMLFYGFVTLWNRFWFPDDWEDALEANKGQLHIIIAKRKDGSLITIRAQSALADALQWIGFEEVPMYLSGLIDPVLFYGGESLGDTFKNKVKEAIKKAPTAALNKVALGLVPDIMAILESAGGFSMYPDVTNWRPLRNRLDPFLRLAAVKRITDEMGFYPEHKNRKGFLNSLKSIAINTIAYENFPDENRYFRVVKLVNEFMRVNKLGSGKFSANITPRNNAAYYFKKALIYGDYESAEKFLARYFQLGGTLKTLRISLKNSHPLAVLPKKYRRKFLNSLTEKDRKLVHKVIKWYNKVFLRHERIPDSVWRAIIKRAKARAKGEGIIKVDKAPYDIVF